LNCTTCSRPATSRWLAERVRGAATGCLYGAPATKRSFEASFFDYVRLEDGLIVERVQQADVLGQMRQL